MHIDPARPPCNVTRVGTSAHPALAPGPRRLPWGPQSSTVSPQRRSPGWAVGHGLGPRGRQAAGPSTALNEHSRGLRAGLGDADPHTGEKMRLSNLEPTMVLVPKKPPTRSVWTGSASTERVSPERRAGAAHWALPPCGSAGLTSNWVRRVVNGYT